MTAGEKGTLNWAFPLVLAGAAAASLLFAIANVAFYLAVAKDTPNAAPVNLWMPLAAAVLNVGMWSVLRRRAYVPALAALFLVVNSALLTSKAALAILAWNSIGPFVGILVPGYLVLAVLAGMLGGKKLAVPIMVVLAAEIIGLRKLLEAHGAPDEELFSLNPAIAATLFAVGLPTAWLSRRLVRREEALHDANARLEDAQSTLSRYLAPQIARKIVEGRGADVWNHTRRRLTIFFSDIKDFTATTDSMEPEDMARVLNEYVDEMVRIAAEHRGTVAQISGDGLFIFFGAPEYVDDRSHALDCVRMAIAMQRRMRELQERWFASGIELPFRIRCGVNTGMATVGGFGSEGRREYTAIGMQTNLAARLEAACEPGQILISHSTWGLVNDEIPCTESGSMDAKGYHRPVQTYRVDLEAR